MPINQLLEQPKDEDTNEDIEVLQLLLSLIPHISLSPIKSGAYYLLRHPSPLLGSSVVLFLRKSKQRPHTSNFLRTTLAILKTLCPGHPSGAIIFDVLPLLASLPWTGLLLATVILDSSPVLTLWCHSLT